MPLMRVLDLNPRSMSVAFGLDNTDAIPHTAADQQSLKGGMSECIN